MGYRELIDALRKEGEEKIRAIRQEAEAEAERVRMDAAKRIDEMKNHYNLMQASAIKEQTDAIVLEAEKKTKTIRLLSEKELSDRLYQLAVGLLHILRDEKYKNVFDDLVQELPPYKLEIVRVNPEDVELAREYFLDLEIIPDNNISGGLEVMTGDGKIKITNTLEKRLERYWSEILPGLIGGVHKEIS